MNMFKEMQEQADTESGRIVNQYHHKVWKHQGQLYHVQGWSEGDHEVEQCQSEVRSLAYVW